MDLEQMLDNLIGISIINHNTLNKTRSKVNYSND